jgi:hypothetical protein
MGTPKTFYCQNIEKWLRSKPRRCVTKYQIGKLFGKYMQAATQATAANGCRATGLFFCDMNIFRPHDFPLASGDTDAAPVNHPALVKTSHQPSFCSVNFWPFTSADFLIIRYQPCAKPELNPSPRRGTAKKITSSQKQLRKRKSSRPLNPKPDGWRRMLFLVLQKYGREGFAGIQLRLTLHQILTYRTSCSSR